MSNILIIKHGSLGDIVQISGALKDIRETHKEKKIFILTTRPYVELMSLCPYINAVLIDKRLPRWNIFYLIKLKKLISKFNFTNVYDLQNSSRTSFYRKYLLTSPTWSSTETVLEEKQKKSDFDNESVLKRFDVQLRKSNINTKYTLKPDLDWLRINVDRILNKYFKKNFLLIFPFCSPKLSHKKWPYFNELIKIIKNKHPSIEIVVAPGPKELNDAKLYDATIITNNQMPLNIMELAGLISKASFIISNDTGPGHMSAHLGKKGIALFGYHTTSKKVSIETENFKALSSKNLNQLSAEKVYSEISKDLQLINFK